MDSFLGTTSRFPSRRDILLHAHLQAGRRLPISARTGLPVVESRQWNECMPIALRRLQRLRQRGRVLALTERQEAGLAALGLDRAARLASRADSQRSGTLLTPSQAARRSHLTASRLLSQQALPAADVIRILSSLNTLERALADTEADLLIGAIWATDTSITEDALTEHALTSNPLTALTAITARTLEATRDRAAWQPIEALRTVHESLLNADANLTHALGARWYGFPQSAPLATVAGIRAARAIARAIRLAQHASPDWPSDAASALRDLGRAAQYHCERLHGWTPRTFDTSDQLNSTLGHAAAELAADGVAPGPSPLAALSTNFQELLALYTRQPGADLAPVADLWQCSLDAGMRLIADTRSLGRVKALLIRGLEFCADRILAAAPLRSSTLPNALRAVDDALAHLSHRTEEMIERLRGTLPPGLHRPRGHYDLPWTIDRTLQSRATTVRQATRALVALLEEPSESAALHERQAQYVLASLRYEQAVEHWGPAAPTQELPPIGLAFAVSASWPPPLDIAQASLHLADSLDSQAVQRLSSGRPDEETSRLLAGAATRLRGEATGHYAAADQLAIAPQPTPELAHAAAQLLVRSDTSASPLNLASALGLSYHQAELVLCDLERIGVVGPATQHATRTVRVRAQALHGVLPPSVREASLSPRHQAAVARAENSSPVQSRTRGGSRHTSSIHPQGPVPDTRTSHIR